ncbi:carboxymuconolactone decarboxylase family protein [Paenibacillus sp. HN-1]|uniref:carboxymuconolactone decarboxylase family protein n=1 Tax=Paenibacillus TaxID=44249 RepID=UPI001CA9751C|nr:MULTISPECIES: carboxymuconolactone decarboxylase family protein [Paenibacillus]MBY9082103.1 carboxymuconolactone decarboxylase family protein [Paenibacillus sp. CGMCC 1.18879]MBY9085739.1 carboxymuconolactone decarboxylase family protein [Paenibacillus sinensis]
MSISQSFMTFAKEAPQQQSAWRELVERMDSASKLDKKTQALAYLAVLAAARLEGGIPFHVKQAKELGATRDEIISSILVGLPAVGNAVIQALPAALSAFDEE